MASVVLRNRRGLEGAVNLAAMFVHFRSQARHIVELTNQEILRLECGARSEAAAARRSSREKEVRTVRQSDQAHKGERQGGGVRNLPQEGGGEQ